MMIMLAKDHALERRNHLEEGEEDDNDDDDDVSMIFGTTAPRSFNI